MYNNKLDIKANSEIRRLVWSIKIEACMEELLEAYHNCKKSKLPEIHRNID